MTKLTVVCAKWTRRAPGPHARAGSQTGDAPARRPERGQAGACSLKACHPLSYTNCDRISYNRISDQPIVAMRQNRYCDTVRKEDIFPLARNWYRRQTGPQAGEATIISAGRAFQDDAGLAPAPAEAALAAWPTSPGFAQRAGSPLSSPIVFECHRPDAHALGDGTQTFKGLNGVRGGAVAPAR